MEEKNKQFLLNVTRELIKNKITGVYNKAPKTGGKQYFALLMLNNNTEKKMNFTTIQENLENNKYESYDQWLADVNKVLSTPPSTADKPKQSSFRMEANKFVVNKLLKDGYGLTVAGWADKVVKLRNKIKEITENPPLKVQQFAPLLFNTKTINDMHVLSQKEVSNFLKAAEMCYSEENHLNMLDIIREEEPELQWKQEDLTFDINRLKLTTIKKLQEYMARALKKKGLEYPK